MIAKMSEKADSLQGNFSGGKGMRTINVEDMGIADALCDTYSTCKYLERQGVSLEGYTFGNAHDEIEEATDDLCLPIVQVINPDGVIEGYIIGA